MGTTDSNASWRLLLVLVPIWGACATTGPSGNGTARRTFDPNGVTATEERISNRGAGGIGAELHEPTPNPASATAEIVYRIDGEGETWIDIWPGSLLDRRQGSSAKVLSGIHVPGEYKVKLDITALPPGSYTCELKHKYGNQETGQSTTLVKR